MARPSAPARAPSITQELAKVALVVALPLVGLLAWQLYESARTEYRVAADVTRGQAIRIANDMRRDLAAADAMLKRLEVRPLVRALNPDLCDSLIAETAALVPGYVDVASFDAQGRMVCSGKFHAERDRINVADRDWFQRQARTRDFVVGDAITSRNSVPRPIVVASRPIIGTGGEFRGVISATIDLLSWDTGLHTHNGDARRELVSGIVDAQGRVVVRSHDAAEWVGRDIGESASTRTFLAERDGVAILKGHVGVERLWGFVPVPGTDWVAYAGVPSSDFIAPVIRRVAASAAVVLGTLLGAFVLGWIAVRRLSRPILDLAAAVRARAEGNMDVRPVQAGPIEIREVAREFDHLIDRQAAAQNERDAVIVRLQTLLERMPIACITYDDDLRINYANPALERVLGYRPEDAMGRQPFDLWIPPEQAERVRGVFARTRAGELVVHVRDVPMPDGSHKVIEWYNLPLRDPATGRTDIMVLAHDITERVRASEALQQLNAELEQRVAARTAELEIANRELEAFSYSVAHDLRAPLRAIDGFARVAGDAAGGGIGPDAVHAFERIHHNVDRMARLIEDLLTLARIQRLVIHRVDVDLTALARSVMDELRAAAPMRDAQVTIAEGMRTRADAALARVVLENVLGNAWKFTSLRSRAEIAFFADGETFVVRDNGAGFDPRFVDKLFGPFQRLHSEKEFAGTGIGLATVARILRRHGGSIWADGAPDAGATFRFTFGPQDAAPDETFGRRRVTRAALEAGG